MIHACDSHTPVSFSLEDGVERILIPSYIDCSDTSYLELFGVLVLDDTYSFDFRAQQIINLVVVNLDMLE